MSDAAWKASSLRDWPEEQLRDAVSAGGLTQTGMVGRMLANGRCAEVRTFFPNPMVLQNLHIYLSVSICCPIAKVIQNI